MFQIKYVAALTFAASIALAGCSGDSPEEPVASSPVVTEAASPMEETTAPETEAAEPTEVASEPETETSEPAAEAAEITVAPATGETFEGTGYTFTAPEGWADITAELAGSGVDFAAGDANDADGFADNLNVVISPAGAVSADEIEPAAKGELETQATDVTVRDRVMVAGSEAAHLSAVLASEGTDYQIEQYYVASSDQTFVVTFSFSPTVSEADRNDLALSVLATWSNA